MSPSNLNNTVKESCKQSRKQTSWHYGSKVNSNTATRAKVLIKAHASKILQSWSNIKEGRMSNRESIKWNADWKHKLIKKKKCEWILIQASSPAVPIQKWGMPTFLSPGDKFGNVFRARKRLLPKMGPADHLTEYTWLDVRPGQSVSFWIKRVGKSKLRPVSTPSDGTRTAMARTTFCPITASITVSSESGTMLPDCLLILQAKKPLYMTFTF